MIFSSQVPSMVPLWTPFEWALAMILIAFLLCFAAVIWGYLADPKSLRRFPSPSVAAFTPFWAIWKNARGRRYLAVEAGHRKLGPVVRIGPNSISFSDPHAYKAIYGHGSPIIKDGFYDNLAGSTPAMADASDRHLHATKRKNVSSIFSAKHVALMEPKIVDAVHSLLRAIQIKSRGGTVSAADGYPVSSNGEFDLRPWLNMFSFDAFWSVLWSSSYHFLERGNDECKSMDTSGRVTTVHAMDSFQTGVHFNSLCAQLGPFQYRFARWVSKWTRQGRAIGEFSGMARHGTVTRLKRTVESVDFFSFFPVEITPKTPCPLTIPDLVAECASFLNAGNDTTQITLTNVMFQLAAHPKHQDKLYSALTASLPKTAQRVASFAELSQIPYLAACIDETLRLMPPVRFGLPRRTVGKGSMISGHHIPAGVTVSASVHTMHRDESLFHDAEDWIPERWIPDSPDSSEEELKRLKEFVLPFTTGGRACIGRNLAYMELSICLAALVMAFEWHISDTARQSFTHFERFNTGPVSLMISATLR
ncbi:hypothetical protein M409DRAFT_21811 [Zasmidium cellare ATCC 36951]|uniref:Cytochrome P450 n=1 Tax=Zasmidium cellare ATCC 36951 TaxID=1080233 RepID=A0A6A6CKH7_ZASCE|nr:uncharacterized protein M409DRAFT_21811 [Zasmidium cellare ATCC 36951]KAF2167655.1 hypothetical protein M409DRAFT_21811 [Zasmidium cellare ATCC 36951]